MRAVRFKIIKIVKEFVILHDCLSFSVFLVRITCNIIHHFVPLVKRMVSMITIYIFDIRIDYETYKPLSQKHESGLIAIGVLLWLAFYNRFGNVGKHKDTVLVIGLDGDLYKSVLGGAFHKIGYRCFTRQHVIRENRF